MLVPKQVNIVLVTTYIKSLRGKDKKSRSEGVVTRKDSIYSLSVFVKSFIYRAFISLSKLKPLSSNEKYSKYSPFYERSLYKLLDPSMIKYNFMYVNIYLILVICYPFVRFWSLLSCFIFLFLIHGTTNMWKILEHWSIAHTWIIKLLLLY